MDLDKLWQASLLIIGGLLAITGFGIRTLIQWLKERTERNEDKSYRDIKELREDLKEFRSEINDKFRSQGHRNVEMSSEISGLTKLLFDFIKNGKDIERRIKDRRQGD